MSRQQPLIPVGSTEQELVIRKSRFIARAEKVTTRAEAMAFLERERRKYPDAWHHCWAYVLGDPKATASAAMSDDGEPTNTAGKPILSVIQHKGIGNVMVVVVRYFGGIKLGAGGLVRAYSGAAEAVLSALPLTRHIPRTRQTLHADFSDEQPVRHWCEQNKTTVSSVDYHERITILLNVPNDRLDELAEFCGARGIRLANTDR